MNRRSFLQATGSTLAQILVSHRACLNAQGAQPGSAVETMLGRVRGLASPGVIAFKGLRYGASTTGANRFQPPVKPAAWTGVRDAFEYGPRAWQPFRPMIPEIGDALTGSGLMDEDCLSLNLWTPSTGAGQRPVMVWFHGGGQRTGSGNSIFYDGAELARKHNVVAISVNHRLNDSFGDLAAVMSGDNSALRTSAYEIAQRKFAQGLAPAYLYYFNWRSPVRNGKLRTMHCMELPFVFDHPDRISFMTGAGSDRAAIATAMSSTWVAFARTGNPNHSGIPQWAAFNPTTWPTMVFGSRTRAENNPWGAERKAMAAARERKLG